MQSHLPVKISVFLRNVYSISRSFHSASHYDIPLVFSPSAAEVILSQLNNMSMVNLLQKLYTADDQTRQTIMLKVLFRFL